MLIKQQFCRTDVKRLPSQLGSAWVVLTGHQTGVFGVLCVAFFGLCCGNCCSPLLPLFCGSVWVSTLCILNRPLCLCNCSSISLFSFGSARLLGSHSSLAVVFCLSCLQQGVERYSGIMRHCRRISCPSSFCHFAYQRKKWLSRCLKGFKDLRT